MGTLKRILDFLKKLLGGGGEEPPTTKRFRVRVYGRGKPVSNAAVVLLQEPRLTGDTNESGFVDLFPNIGTRNVQIDIIHSNYRFYTESIVLNEGDTELNFSLQEFVSYPLPNPKEWPRIGASYTQFQDLRLDAEEFARRLNEQLGARLTTIQLLSAWAIRNNGPGQYEGLLPFKRQLPFDLYTWNPDYFDYLNEFVGHLESNSILTQICLFELYAWSKRKEGLKWVPNANEGPFRANINDVYWAEDTTFDILPDKWFKAFLIRVVEVLRGRKYLIKIGNEMPERPMHIRFARYLREIGYEGEISVNRQSDTPGQYANMLINSGFPFDRIELHGKDSLDYLDEQYPEEPNYKTFREFYNSGNFDPRRIILSSDGARVADTVENCYDYDKLLAVAKDCKARGFSYEHQLAMKMRPFTDGIIRLDDMDYDEQFMKELRNYVP